jgi:hypothetical protein
VSGIPVGTEFETLVLLCGTALNNAIYSCKYGDFVFIYIDLQAFWSNTVATIFLRSQSMTESDTYNVVLCGDILAGFEVTEVVAAFAQMFKLSPEKAGSMVGSCVTIKKEVELQVAESYRQKLAEIGIDVKLEKLGGADELSLEPMQQRVLSADGSEQHMVEAGQMICPKCNFLQPKAEECTNCGVYIHKVIGMLNEDEDLNSHD